MSGEIKLSADEARGHADDVRTTSEDVSGDITALQGRLSGLADAFTGATATAWTDRFDEVSKQATELMEALGAVGEFLGTAANTIEQTDLELASQA